MLQKVCCFCGVYCYLELRVSKLYTISWAWSQPASTPLPCSSKLQRPSVHKIQTQAASFWDGEWHFWVLWLWFCLSASQKVHAFEILHPFHECSKSCLQWTFGLAFLSCSLLWQDLETLFLPVMTGPRNPFFFFKPFLSNSRRSAFIDCHISVKAWGSKHLWAKPPQKGNSSWLKPCLPTQTLTL